MEEGLTEATQRPMTRPESAKALKLVGRMVKHTAKPTGLSTTA